MIESLNIEDDCMIHTSELVRLLVLVGCMCAGYNFFHANIIQYIYFLCVERENWNFEFFWFLRVSLLLFFYMLF
ncbi:MAG: hypothetical protein ACI8RD_000067 [Bacillariaceae sp.]|jgi:hypothetical protein